MERKIVPYYRVSKDSHKAGNSKSSGLGLDAQINIVHHFYKASIVKEFTEIKSAKYIVDRPILQEAIEYCLNNDAWLCVAKLDRLSRDVDDVRHIHKKLNKHILFCDIPSEGEVDLFTITMYSAFAERERHLISLRTSQALQAKIKREGIWSSGSSLMNSGELNKRAVRSNKKKSELNENNKRASQLIILKYKQGFNYSQIADFLNSNSFTTSMGYTFQATQVKRLLSRQQNAA